MRPTAAAGSASSEPAWAAAARAKAPWVSATWARSDRAASGRATGKGGYGRSAGGLGGRRAWAPDVIGGIANVRGSLDGEIIRRIIRRHVNEVKYCYEQELTKKPDLGGRIMVQFTIAASGQVIASVLQNSTMGNARVENCTVQAVRRWEFPKPLGGGLVIVSYPFVLTPRGGAELAAASPPVEPPVRPIDEALATLAKGAGSEQIERIASLLGLRRLANAEMLAWTIDRRAGVFETRLLVARLLERANRHHDAVRVLSGIRGRRAGRRRRRAARHRRRRGRGRGAQARHAALTW